jgi:hypothetical protein
MTPIPYNPSSTHTPHTPLPPYVQPSPNSTQPQTYVTTPHATTHPSPHNKNINNICENSCVLFFIIGEKVEKSRVVINQSINQSLLTLLINQSIN